VENKLTAKQEKFCQSIADGQTQIAAYKTAYNTENLSDSSIYVHASRLVDNAKITLRISELKAKLEKKNLWTREASVKVLKTIAEGKNIFAKESDKIAAVKELNAMHGFNSATKLEVTTNPLVLILETDEGAD
jgi:phage terminase small subunit